MITTIDYNGEQRVALVFGADADQKSIVELKKALWHTVYNIVGKNEEAKKKMEDRFLYPILRLIELLTETEYKEQPLKA